MTHQQKKNKHNDYGTGIPRHEIEALAECLLPEIRKFFESEEGKREFAEWQAKQKLLKTAEKQAKSTT